MEKLWLTGQKEEADGVESELRRLDYYLTTQPVTLYFDWTDKTFRLSLPHLSQAEEIWAHQNLHFADARELRFYDSKKDRSCPLATTESVVSTPAIDADEGGCVTTMDIPGSFVSAEINELIHVPL